jgi:N-formylglutamate amidohydrolase
MTGITPYRLLQPARDPVLLFDSPHSGRFYPADFETLAAGADLRRAEDAYVDELIGGATEWGACVLLAEYPRCYIDLNREADDLDLDLVADAWPWPVHPTEKTRKGIGLIRRYVTPGVDVNARKLRAAEVRWRLENLYGPYHDALAALHDRLRAAMGFVWHVDWHSMKSVGNRMTPDGDGARRPDFVVGTLDGASAGPALTGLIVDGLAGMGYRVSLNDPYKGATIVKRYGRPADGEHCVQVEINRALYLDEARVEKHDGFGRLQADLNRLARALCGAANDTATAIRGRR